MGLKTGVFFPTIGLHILTSVLLGQTTMKGIVTFIQFKNLEPKFQTLSRTPPELEGGSRNRKTL